MFRILVCAALILLADALAANAQMFGRRRASGRSIPGRNLATDQESVGIMTGNERFLRGNRGRATFVGADRVETQSFVGSEQARTTGTIVSSTAGVTPPPDRGQQINQPLGPTPAGSMYPPKIALDIDPGTGTGDGTAPVGVSFGTTRHTVLSRTQRAVQLASASPIAVTIENRTAILRGTVASLEERRRAETLASFEPGISRVQNLIQVAGADSSLPAPAREWPEPLPPPQ